MATRSGKNACDLLDTDHGNLRKMFEQHEELMD